MKIIDEVLKLLKSNDGYLNITTAKENGIDGKTLQRLTNANVLERAAHGLYIGRDTFPNSFVIAQHQCSKGIFSHDSALFLHRFSDREPLNLTMTVPTGWNAHRLKNLDMSFFYNNPKKMQLGVCEVRTEARVVVKAFDIERTLCDCLIYIDRLDRDVVIKALKDYLKSSNRDVAKLLEYATVLKIRDMVYRYVEVLT